MRPLNRTSLWDLLGFRLLLSHRFASLYFPPIPFHPWTSNLCSISPLLSSLLVIRPANFNLLPLWVGCTSGTYFTGGTIPIFTPCTGRYEETLTICFHQQKQPVSVNMPAGSTTTLQFRGLRQNLLGSSLVWPGCSEDQHLFKS